MILNFGLVIFDVKPLGVLLIKELKDFNLNPWNP